MRKQLILFVILFSVVIAIFNTSYCQTMSLSKTSFIDTLLYKSDSLSVGMTLLHLDDLHPQIIKLKVFKNYDTLYHIYNRDNELTKNDYNELFNHFNNYLEKRANKRIKSILLKWIRFEDIMNFSLAGNDTLYVEELFYNIPDFKPLFKKYHCCPTKIGLKTTVSLCC